MMETITFQGCNKDDRDQMRYTICSQKSGTGLRPRQTTSMARVSCMWSSEVDMHPDPGMAPWVASPRDRFAKLEMCDVKANSTAASLRSLFFAALRLDHATTAAIQLSLLVNSRPLAPSCNRYVRAAAELLLSSTPSNVLASPTTTATDTASQHAPRYQ